MSITKKNLVKRIHEYYPEEAIYKLSKIIDSLFDEMVSELIKSNTISICNFGTFTKKKNRTTKRRHPRTKEIVYIKEHESVKFIPSNNLIMRLERNVALQDDKK